MPDRITEVNQLFFVQEHERRIGKVEERLDDTASKGDIHEVREDIKGLRNTLVTFAFTIAGAAVVFAIGILKVLG